MAPNNPPCRLSETAECTPKSALECYELGTKKDEEFPRLQLTAACFVEKDVKKNRERLLKCALARLTSDQFDEKPTGPLE